MSKRKRKAQRRPPARRRKTKKNDLSAILIPAIVGVVVVAVIVGAIFAIETSRSTAASGADGGTLPLITAQPNPTRALPYPEVPRISLEDTRAGQASGEVVVVDVRSENSYDTTHITGAISVPETEIETRLDQLPRDKTLVLYCT
jgi:hypothetical protein